MTVSVCFCVLGWQKEEGEEEVTLPPPRVAKRKEMLYKGREGVRLAPPVHPGQSYNPLEAHREDILKQVSNFNSCPIR